MLLMFIMVVIMVICIVLSKYFHYSSWKVCFDLTALMVGVILITMMAYVFDANVGTAGKISSMEEKYNSLMLKAQILKTTACRDEFGILNKEFIDEIETWNMDIAKGKTNRNDILLSIYTSPAYDNFDTIDLKDFEFKTTKRKSED